MTNSILHTQDWVGSSKRNFRLTSMTFTPADIAQAHDYGVFHGVYITVVLTILLYALSYHIHHGHGARKIASGLGVVTLSFLFFGLYGVFFEQTHHAVTSHLFSVNFLQFTKFAAPLALLTATFVFIRYVAPLSLQAYRLISKYRFFVSLLYAIDIAVLVALFFITDINYASLLILLNFIPHMLATIYYAYVALKQHYGLLLASIYSACFVIVAGFIWLLVGGKLNLNETTYIAVNAYFCLVIILIGFITLRYGYNAAVRFAELDGIDSKNIMHDIVSGIEHDEFFMVYQPKLRLTSNQVCGFEAFVRWQHPEHGLISPAEFIEIAEQSNQIDDLFAYTLKRSVMDTKTLHDAGLNLPVSLNFSSKNLSCANAALIIDTLKHHELPANMLILELTESILLTLSPETNKALAMLHFGGIKLSLDDYGTGFSSLGYLHKLKVHEIKIDKSFISEIESNNYHQIIVESVIYMAKRLGIEVVAEGVESEQTKTLVRQHGCDIVQGYLVSKPMTKHELFDYLSHQGLLSTTTHAPRKASTPATSVVLESCAF